MSIHIVCVFVDVLEDTLGVRGDGGGEVKDLAVFEDRFEDVAEFEGWRLGWWGIVSMLSWLVCS